MNEPKTIEDYQSVILEYALPHIPFDGWSNQTLYKAAKEAGYDKETCHSAFPDGVTSAIKAFADRADKAMLGTIEGIDARDLSFRGKIARAIEARLEYLKPYKEAERKAIGVMVSPVNNPDALKILWRTADHIWDWAGDTSDDYNRYTKRVLLSGVLTKVYFYWLDDESDNFEETRDFIRRQLDQVVERGKMVQSIKPALDLAWQFGRRLFKR